MSRNKIILLLLLTILLQYCEGDKVNYCHQMGRESGDLFVQSIREISNDSIDIWLTVTDTVLFYEPVFYRIHDQEAFDNLVNSNHDDLKFNFLDYTLLMGYFFEYCGQNQITEQRVSLHCGYHKQSAHYYVNVEVQKEDASFIPIQFNAIVEKLPEGLRIGNSVYVIEKDTLPN